MSYFNIFYMSYFKISAKDVLLHSGMENMNHLFMNLIVKNRFNIGLPTD